jgi:hypothetical protein
MHTLLTVVFGFGYLIAGTLLFAGAIMLLAMWLFKTKWWLFRGG